MTFVCSVRYTNGSIKYKNIIANDEVDACWIARDYARNESASLVNVSHARNGASRPRTRPSVPTVG